MNDILEIILKDTYTLSTAKHRVRLLKTYLYQKLFGESIPGALEDRDLRWLNSLPEGFLEKFNRDNVLSNLSELEKRINQFTPLIFYLAFEINDEATVLIGTRVREYFGPNLLLDIRFNPALLAGCALSWKGIYKDYSLKAQIEARKMEILESFKKFLR